MIKSLAKWFLNPLRFASRRRSRRNPNGKARVLVTGDLGKLGSKVANHLAQDYDVVGYDIRGSWGGENLNNYRRLKRRMAGCQYVVHTAGMPHPDKGTIEDYFRVNVAGSLTVMRAAEANNVKRFIYFSSVGYYGCNIKGKLNPAYFPMDESHPVASVPNRSTGRIDAYNQSKVMAEELLAWFGTNQVFEAISLRVAPANKKVEQYPKPEDEWRANPRYRRGAFWTNCHPDSLPILVKSAIEADGKFEYEAFNICDKYAPEAIDVKSFLAEEYPDVAIRDGFVLGGSLITSEKAERMIGYKPCEDVR